jgi:hypothetical protein
MKNFVINFMVSYAFMLGTFSACFLSYRLIVGDFNAFIFGCIMAICALFSSRVIMMTIEEISNNIKN